MNHYLASRSGWCDTGSDVGHPIDRRSALVTQSDAAKRTSVLIVSGFSERFDSIFDKCCGNRLVLAGLDFHPIEFDLKIFW